MRRMDHFPRGGTDRAVSMAFKRTLIPLPQIRVLLALLEAGPGGLTRAKISLRVGNRSNTVTGRAVGYSDPVKRKSFEASDEGGNCPSLITRGYVQEMEIDVDGLTELAIVLTDTGRAMATNLKGIGMALPPLRKIKPKS